MYGVSVLDDAFLAAIYDKRNNFWTGLRKLGGDCDGTSGCVGVLTWQDGDAFAGGSFLAENQVSWIHLAMRVSLKKDGCQRSKSNYGDD